LKTLLELDNVAPNALDEDSRTPLLWGAGNGHAGVVKMLLEREDVTPNTADKHGRTPLSWAAKTIKRPTHGMWNADTREQWKFFSNDAASDRTSRCQTSLAKQRFPGLPRGNMGKL